MESIDKQAAIIDQDMPFKGMMDRIDIGELVKIDRTDTKSLQQEVKNLRVNFEKTSQMKVDVVNYAQDFETVLNKYVVICRDKNKIISK